MLLTVRKSTLHPFFSIKTGTWHADTRAEHGFARSAAPAPAWPQAGAHNGQKKPACAHFFCLYPVTSVLEKVHFAEQDVASGFVFFIKVPRTLVRICTYAQRAGPSMGPRFWVQPSPRWCAQGTRWCCKSANCPPDGSYRGKMACKDRLAGSLGF